MRGQGEGRGRAGDTSPGVVATLADVPGVVLLAVVAGAYFGLAQYVIWLNDPVNAGAGYWPAAGITLAALVLLPTRRWGWVVASVVVAEVGGDALHGYPLAASLWWAAGNAVEPVVGAVILRASGADGRLTPLPSLLWFLGGAVVVGPLVGAAVGAVGTAAEYGNAWEDVLVKWWAGDGLGVLVVAPLLLCFREVPAPRRSRLEAVALAVVVVAVPVLAFRSWHRDWDIALPYVVFPLVMWGSVRFGIRGAAAVGFVVAEVTNLANGLGYGPFERAAADDQALTILQIFLGTSLSAGLVVATLVGDALRRTRELERQRSVAHALQRTVLPDRLPDVPDHVFAARYVPASEDAAIEVGGDWYDAFVLPDGSVGLAVGDVAGHDLAAAVVMGQLRNGLRTYFVENPRPDEVLGVLDRQLARTDGGPFATALCARISGAELVWANAGHPPLLLLSATDTACYLEDGSGPLLGLGGTTYGTTTTILAPGDVVVAFTDGLFEHRSWSLGDGLAHVAAVVDGSASRDPEALCDLLLAEGLDGRPREDDACLLVLAYRPSSASGSKPPSP